MAERFEIVEKALIQMLEEKKYATLRSVRTSYMATRRNL